MRLNIFSISTLAMILVLVGAGCTSTSSRPSTQTTITDPAVQAPSEIEDEEKEGESARYAALDCPEGTVLYDGADITFCYEEETADGDTIIVDTLSSGVSIATQTNPDFVHSVTRLDFDSELDSATAIETLYMTDAVEGVCEVVSMDNGEYVISGGDLDAQLSCGTYKDGYFQAYAEFPGTLLYVEVGQDTFFPSDTWRETLRPAR